MGKWENVFMLAMISESEKEKKRKIIERGLGIYHDHYGYERVPLVQRFSEYTKIGWTSPTEETFGGRIGIKDKLLIFGHGNSDEMGPDHLSPQQLADQLSQWGLQNVGVISFKACEIGQGTFLEDFRKACEERNINVGWIKGYDSEIEYSEEGGQTHILAQLAKKKTEPGSKHCKIIPGTAPCSVPVTDRYLEASLAEMKAADAGA